MSSTKCPLCGEYKKPWFKFCWECSEKESKKPTCEICNAEVPEGHTLCKTHWKEKQEEKKKLNQVNFVKTKKELDYREKYEGTYYFGGQKVKSKSELLICYFLKANNIQFQYDMPFYSTEDSKEVRPDFILQDEDNNTIILEHFGLNDEKYVRNMNEKRELYKKFCENTKKFFFVETCEEDMKKLSEKLGKKLNSTPLKRAIWN